MLQTSMLHLKDVEAHTNYALDGVTQNDWAKCSKHVLDIERKVRRIDGVIDPELVIISLTHISDRSASDTDSSDSV